MITRIPQLLLFSLPWLLLPVNAVHAGDETATIDQIVVQATRSDLTVPRLSQSVEIITLDDIENRQALSVTDLLRYAAGINMVQQGGRGSITSAIVRGGEPNFTVVLIDGVKVNDPTNTRGGSYDFSYLDVSAVERIEIIRGPMSANYGSDALAGVINIITRTGKSSSSVGLEYGGHGLARADASISGRGENLYAHLSASKFAEEGDVEGNEFDSWTVTGGAGATVGETTELNLSFRYLDADSTTFPEESGGPLFAVLPDLEVKAIEESHVKASADGELSERWSWDLAASRYERLDDTASPGIAPGVFNGVPPNSVNSEFTRDQAIATLRFNPSASSSILVGGEFTNEDGDSSGIIDFGFPLPTDFQFDRETVSAFLQTEVQLGSVNLQASVRRDDPSDVSAETSTQLGAVYSLANEKTFLRASLGEGFKAPSFFALSHPLVGNPDLESETARSAEIGVRQRLGEGENWLEVAVFKNEYKNLIDFDPELFTNVNRSSVETRGVELSARLSISDAWQLSTNISYLDTDIKGTDAQLRSRPKWRLAINANYEINEQWRLFANALAVDEFWEVSIPTGGLYLDGYARLDVGLTYSMNDAFSVGLAIDNVLDEDYQESVGFPAAGTRGRVRLKYQF